MAQIIINSEADLWSLFDRLLESKDGIVVDGVSVRWRPELLYFPNAAAGHAVSPSIAKSIAEFHRSLARAYAFIQYGHPNAQLLRKEDKEILDIAIYVGEGSNVLEIFENALERLINGMVGKMTGRQITSAIALLLILFFSSTVAKNWIEEGAKTDQTQITASERERLSVEETNRLKLVIAALSDNQRLAPLKALSDESKEPLVRSVLGAGRARIVGAELTDDDAKEILSKPRERGVGRRVDGVFEVIEIDVENPAGWMGTLKDTRTQEQFRVSINDGELPSEDVQALFEALRKKGEIEGMINGWFVGDKLVSASIVRANGRRE